MPDPAVRKATAPAPTRRAWLSGALGSTALLVFGEPAAARRSHISNSFHHWVIRFPPRALRRGVSRATYDRVMDSLMPDLSVFQALHAQPEFTEKLWQYINRRCSDWRMITGRERARQYAPLLTHIERVYGVNRYIMLALWGMESSFGDVVTNSKYMGPVIPALAALAWRDPRRRRYRKAELLNALVVVERGWAKPQDMIGSWAGAMGHTQWMLEVWLHMGVDFDHDGHINPFGNPADAFAGTARYLEVRGRYRRGEAWGCEVKIPRHRLHLTNTRTWRTYARWHELGIRRADGKPFARPHDPVRLWLPVRGGPAFLTGQNFRAVYSYDSSSAYALATCHLADLIRGGSPFKQQFPGGERIPTIAEVKEIQCRLKQRGFKIGMIDGRTGSETISAVPAFERTVGMHPADGYVGLKVLARLRQNG